MWRIEIKKRAEKQSKREIKQFLYKTSNFTFPNCNYVLFPVVVSFQWSN